MSLETLTAAFQRLATVAVPVGTALALAACASTPVSSPTPAPVTTAVQKSTSTAQTTPPAALPGAGSSGGATSLPPYLDPNSPISQRHSVYFPYDSNVYRAEDKAVIDLQGQYLAAHPDVHVQVVGNTDERGGSEYNLALGERRATAVKTALGLLGVKDAQVEATSYGKEKPVATGHDEASWQKNRRADFVYPAR